MFALRGDEPDYARLAEENTANLNRYGNPIQLIATSEEPVSLRINGDDGIGHTPNRTKQHAFHFNADNCIGCHACEAACSEKNDLEPHLSFRSVGYVEGGTYPNYQRMNISMACNHCDDPVCLKGCPTRAYTKHAEYGAVIQDPEICFGCGYCTWVCPYNAPQLDPLAGQVEKCNMCVDRLEVGLKPACVSACVGNALDFGVVENTPEGKTQIETWIPGFPDPSITNPNIRFEQKRGLPESLSRTDSAAVKYEKTGDGYQPQVDPKEGTNRHWNLKKLSSRENPLVAFTLLIQSAIGGFIAAMLSGAADAWLSFFVLTLIGAGLLASTSHLGKPFRFYRGFNNLKHSNLSREALATVIFGGLVGLHFLQELPGLQELLGRATSVFGYLAIPAGIATLYYMALCYLIKARPFWNHWQTATAFTASAMIWGGWITLAFSRDISIVPVIVAGMLLEAAGLAFHARDFSAAGNEGAVSHYIQKTTFGKTYLVRNVLLVLNMLVITSCYLFTVDEFGVWILLALSSFAVTLIGRALFYVLVVPTTMPSAFFWRNKAFEQHARDLGLAANPNVGVALVDH